MHQPARFHAPPPLTRGEVALAALAIALAAASSHAVIAADAAHRGGLDAPSWIPAVAGAFSPVVATFVEVALYGAFWRSLGRPFPFACVWIRTVALSMPESLAMPVIVRAHAEPQIAPMLAWFVGPRALDSDVASGFAAAFAGAGLIAAGRLALAAHVHARAVGVRWTTAFAVIAGGWLLTRLLVWWTVDLVIGRSLGAGA